VLQYALCPFLHAASKGTSTPPNNIYNPYLVTQAQLYLYGVELDQRRLPHERIIGVDYATSVDIHTKVLQGTAARIALNEHVGMARGVQHG
jgi:hypothetical protein